MSDFEYDLASSAEDASARILADPDGFLLAGGMTLLPSIKLGLAAPTRLVDLSDARLAGISVEGNRLIIGAMTRHADVAASSEVVGTIPALTMLAAKIGDPQVRNRGTIGGSIANNDPASDYPAACLGLGASIKTTSREISADDFFVGLFETALDEGEVITSVSFPVPEKAAYQKFPNPASRYAIVGVFVSTGPEGVRVAVTGAGKNGVYRESAFEEVLARFFDPSVLDNLAADYAEMATDVHAAADYRAHLVNVMARRAVESCA